MKKHLLTVELVELACRAIDDVALDAVAGGTTHGGDDETKPDVRGPLPPLEDLGLQPEDPDLHRCYVCGQTSSLPFRWGRGAA